MINSSETSSYFGPGIWYIIHKSAYDLKRLDCQDAIIERIKKLVAIFPCEECSSDGLNYIKQNPIERYKNVVDPSGKIVGLFMWTVTFHNYVNEKLKKQIMPYEDAVSLYEARCHDTCDISKFL